MIIYKITNKINGKVYIGQTINCLRQRWREHRNARDKNFFHYAIRKYGAENFTVEQIDVACDRNELDDKERYWIQFYDSANHKKGYNLMIGGSTFGGHHTERSIKKMSDALKGSENPMFGKHHTEKAKCKMSKAKMGNTNFKGKRHSEEAKRKQSEVKKGKYAGSKNPNARTIICIETGEIFYCIREAAKKHNVHWKSIWKVCKGKFATCKGFRWRYVND